MDLASAVTGLPAEKFGVVARLLVPHSARGRGVGSSLLRAAASRSVDIGRRPILDVHTALEPAIRLYERCGWVRIGIVAVTFQNGVTLDEFVYLAPDDTDQPS